MANNPYITLAFASFSKRFSAAAQSTPPPGKTRPKTVEFAPDGSVNVTASPVGKKTFVYSLFFTGTEAAPNGTYSDLETAFDALKVTLTHFDGATYTAVFTNDLQPSPTPDPAQNYKVVQIQMLQC